MVFFSLVFQVSCFTSLQKGAEIFLERVMKVVPGTKRLGSSGVMRQTWIVCVPDSHVRVVLAELLRRRKMMTPSSSEKMLTCLRRLHTTRLSLNHFTREDPPIEKAFLAHSSVMKTPHSLILKAIMSFATCQCMLKLHIYLFIWSLFEDDDKREKLVNPLRYYNHKVIGCGWFN